MNVVILKEDGHEEALFGIGLNKSITSPFKNWSEVPDWMKEQIKNVALKLSSKDGGHNKFLETITVWLDIDAPLYFWKQFDTYRIGVTKQSESTMHTLMNRPLVVGDFEGTLDDIILERLNKYIASGNFDALNKELPQSFKQRRIICTNYKTLKNMVAQRKHHKLVEWNLFCKEMVGGLRHGNFLGSFDK